MFFILSPMLFTSSLQPLQQCLLFVRMRFIRSDGWIFSWNSETFYIDCVPMWKNGEAIAPMHISGSSAYGLTRADVQINAERSIYFTFVVDNLLHWISLAWSHLYTTHTHTHTHPFNGPFLGLPRWAGTRKVKPIWILLKQETVSGSGIKCAPCSRQITTPAPHHSVFYRPDALPAAQPTVSQHWRHTCKKYIYSFCKNSYSPMLINRKVHNIKYKTWISVYSTKVDTHNQVPVLYTMAGLTVLLLLFFYPR